jgi:magnesium-transporting ATPase (P-type)
VRTSDEALDDCRAPEASDHPQGWLDRRPPIEPASRGRYQDALLARLGPQHHLIDEIPFDFARRLMSMVVERPAGTYRLICKGAPEAVFARTAHYEHHGEILPIEGIVLDDLRIEYEASERGRLPRAGNRVSGI